MVYCGLSGHTVIVSRFLVATLAHTFLVYSLIQRCGLVATADLPNDEAAQLIDGPSYLHHLQAFVLCMSECENLVYISDGSFPSALLIKFHVFSNWSSAHDVNKGNNTEQCTVDFVIREQGVFHGHFGIQFPPLYHVVPYLKHNPFRDLPFAALRQTLFNHIELEVASWFCARHSAKVVPSTPIRIASRTLFLKWFTH